MMEGESETINVNLKFENQSCPKSHLSQGYILEVGSVCVFIYLF